MCPITQSVMQDPVVLSDGMSYERHAIEAWLRRSRKSPCTGQRLVRGVLLPNHALRNSIGELIL